MRISKEQKAETRKKILEAGLEVMYKNGYHGTGIKDVTMEAKIPKGSFFNYFDTKEEYAVALIQLYLQKMHKHILPLLHESDKDFKSRLGDFFDAMNQKFIQNDFSRGCLMGNLGAELADTSDNIRVEVARSLAEIESELQAVLKKAQLEHDLDQKLNTKDLAAFILNAWEGALLRMKIDKSEKPITDFKTFLFSKLLK